MSEGFSKDCVLKINDAKFLSAGRIDKLDAAINNDTLEGIQHQLFSVCFPDIKRKYDKTIIDIGKLNKKLEDQKNVIAQLKSDKNRLIQLMHKS